MLSPSSSNLHSQAKKLTQTTSGSSSDDVIPIESIGPKENPIQILPIGIALPSAISSIGGNGIVGSIVAMGKKSAMVWISWGPLDAADKTSSNTNTNHQVFASMGKGTPTMGQLVVSMPRTNYAGAFATGSKEASCSQMVGSSSSEDQILANQMASRLSLRSGMAIYVSCQLFSTNTNVLGGSGSDEFSSGLDTEMLSHRAASLAEKEIWRILQKHQQ